MIVVDPKTTALVLIDLQNGVVRNSLAPHTGADVVERAKRLAQRFRQAKAPVVLVRVSWSADGGDVLRQRVDEPMQLPPGGFPAGFADLAPELEQPGDIVITKRQWGAFYGTDLDLQLRRRSIRSIVLAGVATNFGVESSARAAFEHGYEIVIAADVTTSRSQELHELSMKLILPRLARITSSDAIELTAS